MRRFFSAFVLALAMLMSCSMAFAAPSDTDTDINGDLEDGVYSNSRYGFSLHVPQGWQVAPEEARQTVEKTTYPSSAADTRLFLLLVRPGANPVQTDPSSANTAKDGVPAPPDAPSASAVPDVITVVGAKFGSTVGVSYNTAMVYLKTAAKSKTSKVIRQADAFWMGGTQVARQDTVSAEGGREQYTAHMLLAIRDRLISFQVHSATRERMEEGVGVVAAIVEFEPDWQARSNSHEAQGRDCGTALVDGSGAAREGGCATPGGGTSVIAPQRVRVSESVLQGLLVSKVAPELPSGLEPEMIKAPVQMRVLVGADGTVEKIWVFEGSAELAWNAVSAVRQWRFKPYALEGQPVKVEGTLTVDFK